ncbi:uncharacterized protein BCR38DRAFT_448416 [Pseudomassariella vexata]|uniref:Uncharacterized protein n=1 Tax=Pseudomassariella vexata TaxID=1141098 RepID=A0A1Y2DGA7_9PEZI|nr:uncharacterized protein BCR38DRAFT_448416 [Pseudomassariella vexata]ORY58237.1 hypothetical protein BCR38DRAFT_448416 [Pseudomassariella vexata]
MPRTAIASRPIPGSDVQHITSSSTQQPLPRREYTRPRHSCSRHSTVRGSPRRNLCLGIRDSPERRLGRPWPGQQRR